jgi:acyl-coenzyme A synthetase/AMP-(fatty) acid ligase
VHDQYAGEITVKKLGFDVDIFDDYGKSCAPGEAGELVVKKAFPSAAVKFWNDPNYEKYHAAYYERFPGIEIKRALQNARKLTASRCLGTWRLC